VKASNFNKSQQQRFCCRQMLLAKAMQSIAVQCNTKKIRIGGALASLLIPTMEQGEQANSKLSWILLDCPWAGPEHGFCWR
jgi:hypothetical protein